ncbi:MULTISPECIES: carbohydrate ABC transporter permease [Acetoanaerobium]|jgi:raffinose/stachyose/melibiose transport system permease protein|uniref:carbohydrate ABC transporter permease n=1 Tax=Acetoanaerobium TaxID=186831 RepID=UPI001B5792B3|nr:carbohydrate ABC transporter permease [Acetoanaerobium noterae]MBP8762372.1 carbohydrate ABC transporter permease [Acetoanaerobium sp.]MBP9499639.1 carbohydrate ABC transporter permease [Acetoanaerobium sp.]MDK2803238.1 maltose transport system permease protein [Peptostreptococcaceae bacterium]
MVENQKKSNNVLFFFMTILAITFLVPIFIVLMNSFKGQFFISDAPFSFPTEQTFVGFTNYLNGIEKINFFSAFGYSLFITVGSVLLITICTSMTAWYITRVKSKITSLMYYLFAFSMIVPFQMVMFTMSKTVNVLRLDNPVGMILIYLGFGAGLSVFMFAGFIKSIPLEIEEAAMIDGCNPIQTFFLVVFPILKPTAITVSILNTMWIWNDYLLPYLVIGNKYRTLPVAIQYLQGGYGSRDMGALMAMLILAIIPIVVFYLSAQKYIIKGVISGAVKG